MLSAFDKSKVKLIITAHSRMHYLSGLTVQEENQTFQLSWLQAESSACCITVILPKIESNNTEAVKVLLQVGDTACSALAIAFSFAIRIKLSI